MVIFVWWIYIYNRPVYEHLVHTHGDVLWCVTDQMIHHRITGVKGDSIFQPKKTIWLVVSNPLNNKNYTNYGLTHLSLGLSGCNKNTYGYGWESQLQRAAFNQRLQVIRSCDGFFKTSAELPVSRWPKLEHGYVSPFYSWVNQLWPFSIANC